jgi:hypothetical protein
LQSLVSLINPKADYSTKSIVETIAPYLNEEIIEAIEEWQFDDIGDNKEIEEISKYCREIFDIFISLLWFFFKKNIQFYNL